MDRNARELAVAAADQACLDLADASFTDGVPPKKFPDTDLDETADSPTDE